MKLKKLLLFGFCIVLFSLLSNFVTGLSFDVNITHGYHFNNTYNDSIGTEHGTNDGTEITTDKNGNPLSALGGLEGANGGDDVSFDGSVIPEPYAGFISLWTNQTDCNIAQSGSFFNRAGTSRISIMSISNLFDWNFDGSWVCGAAGCAAIPCTNNEWTHLVLTYNDSTAFFYQDGVRVSNISGKTYTTGSGTLYIGSTGIEAEMAGEIDELVFGNKMLSNTEVTELYNNYDSWESTPVVVNNFTITAKDIDGNTINSFNISFDGVLYETTNGTVTAPVLNNDSNLHNITFVKNTFFNSSFINYNVSTNLDITGLYQAIVNFNAIDNLTGNLISNFSVNIYYPNGTLIGTYTNTSTNIDLYFTLNKTNYNYTVFQNSFGNNVSGSFVLTAQSNQTFTVYLYPIIQLVLLREKTNMPFDISNTNSTTITFYCSSDNNTFSYTLTTNVSLLPINCIYTFAQISVTYTTDSYFRTLIVKPTNNILKFFLLDLNAGDTSIKQTYTLIDLTNEFSNGYFRLKKVINGTTEAIIEQYYDLSNAITLYMLKDSLYTASVINNAGAERSLGNLIADQAATKTITLPDIQFIPITDQTISYGFEEVNGTLLRAYYNDTTATTTSVTFQVQNTTGGVIYTDTSTSNNVVFTYNGYNTSSDNVVTKIYYTNTYTTNGSVSKTFANIQIDSILELSDFGEDATFIKLWAGLIGIALIALSFSIYSITAGIFAVGIFTYFFMEIGWVTSGSNLIDSSILAIIGLVCVIMWYLTGGERG